MRKILRPAFWLMFLGAGVLVAAPFFYLNSLIQKTDFKAVTEAKVKDFLQADVKINHINLGQLNEVDLSGLEITPQKSADVTYQVKVDKIIFRYDLFQLLAGSVSGPNAVILKSPELLLSKSQFPYDLFRNIQMGSSRSRVSMLEFRGGRIRAALESLNSEMILDDIRGHFSASGNGMVLVSFQANASGLLTGKVKVNGSIDPLQQEHDLRLELIEAAFSKGIALPYEGIQGSVRWKNDNFFFENIETQIRGWESTLSGSIEDISAAPRFSVLTRMGRKDFFMEIPVSLDMASKKINIKLVPSRGDKHEVTGDVEMQKLEVGIQALLLDGKYSGSGNVDFSGGNFQFDLTHFKQRFGITGNLRQTDMNIEAKFDHAQFYGLDVVGAVAIHLDPLPFMGEDRYWRFKADFQSSYFVLQYVPFDNFKGSFEIDRSGIQNLISTWGTAFAMSGNYSFDHPEKSAFAIKITDLNLGGLKEFASKPLPEHLNGVMAGRIKIEGDFEKPAVSGSLSIKDGLLSQLEFDRAVIEFAGTPPKLLLEDSRIIKGRTKLNLVGSIDLSSQNILEPIEIQTAEKFVIWKGIQLNAEKKADEFEISTPLGKNLPPLAVKAGYRSGEYSADNNSNFQDEGYVATGPKIKF